MNALIMITAALLSLLAASGLACAQSPSTGIGQAYPVKAIKMIVGSTPGGGPDIMARAIGQKLAEAFGQPVIIDNRPGANGIIGSEIAAKSPADGYTLIMANAGSHAVNVSLYPKLNYDPVRDFTPVSLVSTAPNVLIVHPSLPVKNVKELIALARARPGEMSFGSGGNGSTAHLSGELFRALAGLHLVHVPFRGAPAAVLGVASGQVVLALPNLPPALPAMKSGKARALGVTTSARSASAPEVPTIAESGLPGYEANAWYGVLAPTGTSRDIVIKLNAEIVRSLRTDDMKQRISLDGGDAVGSTPEAFGAVIKSDIAKWAKVVRFSGAKVE
ncbi:MAG: tripartite tricarboxylate transporter substrate binding protein [Burkholderiales bacterium]